MTTINLKNIIAETSLTLSSGPIIISDTTDATNSTSGSVKTAGGLGVAKKLFVGTDLSVGSAITSGTWNGSTIGVAYGGTGATSLTSTGVLIGNGTSAISVGANLTYTTDTLSAPKIVSTDTTASTTSTTGAVLLSGGLGIALATDATSATNGGTLTIAGGVGIAKKLFVGGTGSFGADLNMNNNKITNLATPTASSDAATKGYIDNAIQGLDVKQSVDVATTTSHTLASGFEDGDTIDGVTLATNNRILIKNQSSAIENGIYTVNATGAPSRVADLANGSGAGGSFVFVERGTVNGDTGWVCINDTGSDTVGTDGLVFVQFSGAGSYLAGTGLTLTGNTFSVNASQTQITAVGTITSGNWNGSTITVPYGGTGGTSFTSTAVLLGNGTSAIQSGSGITYSSSTLTLPKITSNDSTATTSSATGAVLLSGGLGISNTTDATSATNGGTITTAGGVAIAKKLFVGTDLTLAAGDIIFSATDKKIAQNTLDASDNRRFSICGGGDSLVSRGAFIDLHGNEHANTGQISLVAGDVSGGSINFYTGTLVNRLSISDAGQVSISAGTSTSSSSTGALVLTGGGIGVGNTSAAISSTNGGSITTAGGLAVAKNVFIGTTLSVGTNITSGNWQGTEIAVSYGGTGASTFTTNGILIGNGTSAVSALSSLTYSSSTLTLPKLISNDATATTSSATGAVLMSGGLGISLTTDATSSTNGGSITTAGGVAIAKKLFVGTDLAVGGNLTVTGTVNIPHSGLTGLTSGDDHTQYVLLTGRSGGQTITGGTASGNNLLLRSTSNATKGQVYIDETTASTTTTTGALRVAGGVGIAGTLNAGENIIGGTKMYLTGDNSVIAVTSDLGLVKQASNNTKLVSNTGNSIILATSNLADVRTSDISAATITDRLTISSAGIVNITSTTATTSSGSGALTVSGGLGISLTTDATNATNGGSITTAGGVAIAKKLFVGTDLSVGGLITSGTWNGTAIAVAYGGTGATTFTSTAVLLGNGSGAIQAGSGITYASSTLTVPKIISNDATATTSSATGAVLMSGGLGISLTTDATSSTNGGSITTAGGVAIAKKLFVGTDLAVGGNLTVTGSFSIPHSGLTGLTSGDDHTQYVLLTGRSGGQTITGGIASGNNLLLRSTSNATKGQVYIDETTASTTTTTGALRVAGGVGIAGAVYSTNVKVNASAGLANYLNTNNSELASTTNLNPGINIFNATGFSYGMDLGFNGATARTRVFYPDTAAFAVATHPASTSPSAQSSFTERLTVSGTGVVNITATTASSNSTSGALTVAGGVGIAGNVVSGGFMRAEGSTSGTNTTAGVEIGLSGTNGAIELISSNATSSPFVDFTYVNTDYRGRILYDLSSEQFVISTATASRMSIDSTKLGVLQTTASTSTTTGALTVAGGVGIAGTVSSTQYSLGDVSAEETSRPTYYIETRDRTALTTVSTTFYSPNLDISASSVSGEGWNAGGAPTHYAGDLILSGGDRAEPSNNGTGPSIGFGGSVYIRGGRSYVGAQDGFSGICTAGSIVFQTGISGNSNIDTSHVERAKITPMSTASSTTNATLVVTGGIGVSDNVFVGGSIIGATKMYLSGDNSVIAVTSDLGLVKQASNNTKLVSNTGNSIILATSNLADVRTSDISAATITDRLTISSAGIVNITSTTASTSTTTGALTVAGGVGVAGNVVSGGFIRAQGSMSGTNSTAGVEIGLSGTNSGIELISSNATSSPFVDFTYVNTDYRGRILYDLSSEQFVISTATASRMSIDSTKLGVLQTTASTSTTTGALTVAGGVGVAGNIYSGGIIGNSVSGTVSQNLADFLRPSLGTTNNCSIAIGTAISTRNATFLNFTNQGGTGSTDNWAAMGVWGVTGELRVTGTGQVYATSTTASSSTTTGALRVDGGIGVAGQVNIGGGATITGGELDINHTSPILTIRNGTVEGKIYFGNGGHGIGRGANIGTLTNGNDVSLWTSGGDGNIGLATQTVQRLIVEAGGDVQAVNKLRAGSLQAEGTSSIASQGVHIQWNKSSGGGESKIITQVGAGSDDAIYMSRSTTGNVVTDWAKFSASGLAVYVGANQTFDPSFRVNGPGIDDPGSLTVNIGLDVAQNIKTAGVYGNSDARLKHNIQSVRDQMNYSGFIDAIDSKMFQWISDGPNGVQNFGYIAQDLVKHGFGGLVIATQDVSIQETVDEDGFVSPGGARMSINYSNIIPILHENIRDLRQENRVLKHQIETITQRLLALESRFA